MGEDDLLVSQAPGGRFLGAVLLLLGCVAGLAVLYGVNRVLLEGDPTPDAAAIEQLTAAAITDTPSPTLPPTNTRIPPPLLPTITPTVTYTPTEGPCEFVVEQGDTLISLAQACGHRDLAVLDAIVRDNFLECNTCLSIGQTINVPRPTPAEAPPPEEGDGSSNIALVSDAASAEDGAAEDLDADAIIATRLAAAEPTLDPNLMYHVVQEGETMASIVWQYDIDAKLLSEINPEIEFARCDFGSPIGGENCTVMLSVGQRVRVPAPPTTPTFTPTPSGSETPTPTPTATVNVPELYSPLEGKTFDGASLVTLRWVTSGTLGIDEVYLVRVINLETEVVHYAFTCDQAIDLPQEWQPQRREPVEFEWAVSVVTLGIGVPPEAMNPVVRQTTMSLCAFSFDLPVNWGPADYALTPDIGIVDAAVILGERYPTTPRRFYWQGRGT